MEAPDKLKFTDYQLKMIQGLQETEESNHEYIRKDALLEIIKTARESAIVQRNFNNCPAEQEVRIDAYDYIVNKIESL